MTNPHEEEIDLEAIATPIIDTPTTSENNSTGFLDDDDEYGPFQIYQSKAPSPNTVESK